MGIESPPQAPSSREQSDKALTLMKDRANQMLRESHVGGSPEVLNAFYEYCLSEAENPLIEKSQRELIKSGVAFYRKKFSKAYMGVIEHAELMNWLDYFPPKRY